MNTFSRPAFFAVLTTIVVFITFTYQRNVSPPTEKPAYKQPVMAFEFAKTDDDIYKLFLNKKNEPAISFINKMRGLTYIDYLFILCYTLFTISFAWAAKQIYPSVWVQLALYLAPVIGLFDVLENIQLLHILDAVSNNPKASFTQELHWLSIATWIKWETTGILFLLIFPFLWKGGYFSKTIAVVSLVVFLSGIVALITRFLPDKPGNTTSHIFSPYAEAFATLVLVNFVLFMIYSIAKRFVKGQPKWL